MVFHSQFLQSPCEITTESSSIVGDDHLRPSKHLDAVGLEGLEGGGRGEGVVSEGLVDGHHSLPQRSPQTTHELRNQEGFRELWTTGTHDQTVFRPEDVTVLGHRHSFSLFERQEVLIGNSGVEMKVESLTDRLLKALQ